MPCIFSAPISRLTKIDCLIMKTTPTSVSEFYHFYDQTRQNKKLRVLFKVDALCSFKALIIHRFCMVFQQELVTLDLEMVSYNFEVH